MIKKGLFFTAVFFVFVCVTGISAAELDINSLKMNVDGKDYIFSGKLRAVLRTYKGNKSRLMMGFSDKDAKVEFMLSADSKIGFDKREKHLTTRYNDLMILFKSKNGSFMVLPSVKLANSNRMKYLPKKVRRERRRNRKLFRKKPPEWRKMGRDKRISSGKGVIIRKRMAGSMFSLVLIPVIKNGEIVELKGYFSGIGKASNWGFTNKTNVIIKNGEFRTEVKIK